MRRRRRPGRGSFGGGCLYHQRRAADPLEGNLDPDGWAGAGDGRRWRQPNTSGLARGRGKPGPGPLHNVFPQVAALAFATTMITSLVPRTAPTHWSSRHYRRQAVRRSSGPRQRMGTSLAAVPVRVTARSVVSSVTPGTE